ncbi:BppU family phage baseplate upper protein [Limosilactobacillus reuteri]|uniref:BppU family phage baseplate upper protein n=1 Tax=Limosilactobacillus reuteri TaxID=1598 RepID=UPI0011593F16|nr:BppU family phage baseplate upper protein [Limosilactobacillus reuteri]QDK48756.1 hypothetical protein DPH67_06510 [Limosilactobacillus reuteri]
MSQTLTYVIGQDRRPHVDNVQDFKVNFDGSNTNWVQARQYERSMRQVFVNIKNEDGTPLDLTGCNVWFEGLLPKNSAGDFRVIDDKGYVALDPTAGRFRFDMPGHAFTVAGSYRQAFFRILKDGNSITTLEFDLDVLADKVIDGLVPRTYISPVEELINEIEAKYQDSTDKLTKMTSGFVDKFTQSMNTLKALGATVQNGLDALDQKIKQDGLFTQAEADAFKQAIQKEIDEQNTKLNSLESKVNLNALLLSGYNVRDFGALGDGENDDTDAIQKAIKQVALDWKKDNFKTNLVVMPAGRYKVTSTIILPPYVKLISSGLVTIESYLTTGATIRIKWFGEDDPNITGSGLGNAYQIQDWQRGYIIEGTNGGFSFVSKVKSDNNIGIELGFESDKERGDSNLKNIGRSGFNNISIGNYGVGLKLNGIDLFIFNFVNMHIEGNKINVQNMYVDGGNNYGENIYFDRCVIADAEIGIDQACGGYDMVFNECSLGLNKLLFSSSPWADNSISIIGGNLEGNTVIYDGSNDPVNWMTSLNIISSNIYIRKDKTADLLMFKGPLILNLDNPYIISAIEMVSPEYLCDEKVFVTYNRNPSFTRTTSSPVFITERDNVILDGNDMSKIHMNTDRSKGKLVTKDDGLAQELQDAGYSSAYSYTKTSDDDNNWDNFRLVQKIDVRNRSTFFLSIFGIAHGVRANITLYISYYDNDDKLISTNKFYAGLSADQDKVLYGSTSPQHIPINAVNAALAIGVSCKDIGSSFQFGYIGMEVE